MSTDYISPCVEVDGDGLPCDADCNDQVLSQYYEAYGTSLSGRSNTLADGAYLPAVTVCRQELWRRCKQMAPAHPYNPKLYERACRFAPPRVAYNQ
jgi:hypothetical protein